ncbi:hypothetical protein [Luteimonas suaedae]|uniref:hypothetical protein n=1 Tax=Luteimonas suaedae TaxID=2605430 RepID=UPI0011EBD645|nr:hypothetical protein [Luteimonas suaedae]
MTKKFLEGLAFGGGFALSFLAISYFVAFFAMPVLIPNGFHKVGGSEVGIDPEIYAREAEKNFYELSVEDQIREASVIALVNYVPSADGKFKAIINEFLKKEPNSEFHYSIGDEYPPASYYIKEDVNRGDGQIIFFVGLPAEMKMATTYSDGRIRGLGDMPLQLFREKCSGNNL